ncbi:MAG: hypothetical protein DWQ10_14495, partial [Calditrichaeota bacterium]
MFVNVVFPIPHDQQYTYAVSVELQQSAKPGCRVLVPFGQQKRTGYVVQCSETAPPGHETKPIIDLLDATPLLSEHLIKLAHWVSSYYMCSLGETIRAFLPAGMQQQSKKFVELTADVESRSLTILQRKIISTLQKKGSVQLSSLQRIVGSKGFYYNIAGLSDAGTIRLVEKLVGHRDFSRKVNFVKLAGNHQSEEVEKVLQRAPRQAAVLQALQASGGVEQLSRLCNAVNCSSQTVRSLEKKGFVEIFERVVMQDYYGDLQVPKASRLVLNKEQEHAVGRISESVLRNESMTFLLLGVTGSGKTQVYIEVMRQALQMDKGAIVMVPEIALTPQTVSRFRAEFQKEVTVVHSRMSQSERYAAWSDLQQGKCRVVVGPRSAVFAPVKNL